MRLQSETILLDMAQIGSPQFRRICTKMHEIWTEQGCKLNKKSRCDNSDYSLTPRKGYLLSILTTKERTFNVNGHFDN